MEIKNSLFAVLLILFFINTVLDHLFNWWFRDSESYKDAVFVATMLYILKTTILVIILNSIT